MKNIDVIMMSAMINGVEKTGVRPVDFSQVKNITLSYAKHKNGVKLMAEVEAINKVLEDMKPAKYKELETELQAAVNAEVEKAKETNSRFTDRQANEIADKVVKSSEKYGEWQEVSKEYQKVIDEVYARESEIELHKVKLSAIPVDLLTDEQFQAVVGFVEE